MAPTLPTALAVAAPLAAGLGAGAAGLGAFAYATFEPRASVWGRTISSGPRTKRQIALTFDDGPTPHATDRVLDILAAAGVKATFFVIGLNVQKHPDLLRRIHAEGHLVANHSFHHAHLGILRRDRYWDDELRAANEAIEKVLNLRPALFRPPMGMKTWHITRAARRHRLTTVTWTRRAFDGFPTTPQKILARFAKLKPGDILLLHDGVEPRAPRARHAPPARHTSRIATLAALPPLLDLLHEKALEPVRLDTLLEMNGYRGIE